MYGIGVYEKGVHPCSVGRKITKEYALWLSMLSRCTNDGVQQSNLPTYVGCEVHPDFIKFQDFAEWCHKQIGFYVNKFQLDKDILMPGNKVYGPDTCVFVPPIINVLFRGPTNSPYLRGVKRQAKDTPRPWGASLMSEGVRKSLGSYYTEQEAHHAYIIAHKKEVMRLADMWETSIDPRVCSTMRLYASAGI